MKKSVFILLILCLTALPLLAWEVMVIPSLGVNVHDQVQYVMPSHSIFVPKLDKVERGQPFYLYFAVALKEPSAKPLELNGEVVIIKPDGSRDIAAKTKFFELKTGSRGVFTSGRFLSVIMENSDPEGVYRIEFSVSDGTQSKTATGNVELVKRFRDNSPMSDKEHGEFLERYYCAPKPERALAAWKRFIFEMEPAIQQKKNNRFDPRHVLRAFSLIFKKNPQLWDELAQSSVAAKTDKQQLYYALVFAGIGESAVKKSGHLLTPPVQAQIGLFAGKDPLEFKEVTGGWHLDALWVEFMITGNFEPVKKLVNELRRRPVMTLEQARAKRDAKQELSDGDKQAIMNYVLTTAVMWSMTSNIKNHRLLWYYVETIGQRKLYPDDFAARLLAKIIENAVKNNKSGEKK